MKYDGIEYDIKIWQGEELNHILAIDTETMVVPFTKTPDPVSYTHLTLPTTPYV